MLQRRSLIPISDKQLDRTSPQQTSSTQKLSFLQSTSPSKQVLHQLQFTGGKSKNFQSPNSDHPSSKPDIDSLKAINHQPAKTTTSLTQLLTHFLLFNYRHYASLRLSIQTAVKPHWTRLPLVYITWQEVNQSKS